MKKKIIYGILLFQLLFFGITIADNSVKYKQIKQSNYSSLPVPKANKNCKSHKTFQYEYKFGKIDLESKTLTNETFYGKSGKCNKQIGYKGEGSIWIVVEYEYIDGNTILTEMHPNGVNASIGFSHPSDPFGDEINIRRTISKYDAKNLLNEKFEYLEDGTLYSKSKYFYDKLERETKLQTTFYDYSVALKEIIYNNINDTCIIKIEKRDNELFKIDTLFYNRNFELIRGIGYHFSNEGEIITDKFSEIICEFNEQTNLLQRIVNDENGRAHTSHYQYNNKNQLIEHQTKSEGYIGERIFGKTYYFYKNIYKYDKFNNIVEDVYYDLNNEPFRCNKTIYIK